MRTSRSNPLLTLLLVLAVALTIVMFDSAPRAYAQDETPPSPPQPDIVGGGPANPGEWPWQVALVNGTATGPNYFNDQFCGGSLIHPEWVLTAGHCVTNMSGGVVSASSVDIVAGIHNLSTPTGGYQQRNVSQIIRHPSYDNFSLDNDIALLKLSSAVSIGGSGATTTALVPLVPAAIGSLAGTNSWVTGWGNTSSSSTPAFPNELQEVQVPIISNSVCNDGNHYGGAVTGNMLCAGFDAGGKDACQGDSGGPLVVFHNGAWKLAGIVSWGAGCGQPFSPGVYTRVSQYGSWVNQNIGQATTISPTGSIGTNYTPTYTWNAVRTMTYYYLWVNGPSNNRVIGKWYSAAEAGCASGTGTCSVSPTTQLAGGNHTWWIQTWNEAGPGAWSAARNFSTTIPPAPGVANPISPNAPISANMPAYSWSTASNATWYQLWVNGPSGSFNHWYEGLVACTGGTCSATPPTALGAGNYTFWIRTWGPGGFGPWSSGMNFSFNIPGAATLVSPSGNTSSSNPTYTWNRVPGASWYQLWVNGPSGNVIAAWYEASVVCSASTCATTGPTTLGSGAHTFWVRTWNQLGYGPWSPGMNFTRP